MDYDDNFYPGEVITVEADQAKVRFMAPIKRKSGKKLPCNLYWVWPGVDDIQNMNKLSILPVKPVIDLDPMSSMRLIVFKLINRDVI